MLSLFINKTVVVLGGPGSIGSLLVEEIMKDNPYSIRILCNNENELHTAWQKWNNPDNRYLLGDVRDLERMKRALRGADYVFNCSAIKHVPFAEYDPMEAVKTNIIGLENIIQSCIFNKVTKLVHISTDKAVEPTTVMGATKFIGERLLQVRWYQNPKINMNCVRLGNVYSSRGSLIEIFNACIATGIPMRITDGNMERFFMQPKEVSDFIFHAFRQGTGGQIYIPKLESVNILELIKSIKSDHPINIVGRRKGEKLKEILITEEERSRAIESDYCWIINSKRGSV